jgi:hypothetical protein
LGPPAPAPPVAPDRRKDQQPTPFTADANLPPPAMASPSPHRDRPAKGPMAKPASRSHDPIRQQFGAAKRKVTGREKTERPRSRKRKQREDGRQLFIFAKALVKRLARAARRTRTFFWEREIRAAPSRDMHLDPRYVNWYAVDPHAGSAASSDYSQNTVTAPANCNAASLDL